MKIVDVAEFYAPRGGGVRTYIDLKLRAARERGHEVVIVAPGPRDRQEQHAGGRIVWVASPNLPLDPRYRLLTREAALHAILEREAPDVIEASSPWTGAWWVARYRPRPGQPVPRKSLVYHHDPVLVYPQTWLGARWGTRRVDELSAGYWAYLRRLSRRFDVTLVSGAWLASRLRQHGIRNARHVPFGIDKTSFQRARPDSQLRRELLARTGAPPHAALLISVSRLHPEKRIGTLRAAIQQLSASRPVGLVVYGDGPLATYHRSRARGLPIHFAGLTRDRDLMARSLASADALLHGSSAETFGLVVAEALCAGAPIVVPDAGGAFELARPAHAESYRAGDARACAAALARLLARDSTRLRAAARRAGEGLVLSQDQHWERLFKTYAALGAAASDLHSAAQAAPRVEPPAFAFSANSA